MNNLYEYGGPCDVIIRCNTERTIGNKTYTENEPYTILRDVLVELQYGAVNSSVTGRSNIIENRQGYPSVINIRGTSVTTKVGNLLATPVENKTQTRIYVGTALQGEIFLPEDDICNYEVIALNQNNSIVTTCNLNGFVLSSDDFIDNDEYLIIYEIISSGSAFEFDTPSYGYFTVEVIGKGNINKRTREIYLKFPACSLISTALFNFVNGDLVTYPLQFKCINTRQENPYFIVGD